MTITPSLNEKIATLTSRGWTVGKRDARLNTKYPGEFMCVEEFSESDYELPTEDGADGTWCVVGDDLEMLVDIAYAFDKDMQELNAA